MIIIFFLLLLVLIVILYFIKERQDKKLKHNNPFFSDTCEGTRWGCCPDGITVRQDNRGTNCFAPRPSYHAEPFFTQG
jgi:hypothetical protein